MQLTIPDPAMIVLVGAAGCGKSTFAQRHFAPDEVLSSDGFRAIVAGDPGDQSATAAAFSLLRHALDLRARRRRLTVVDATNLTPSERSRLLGVARKYELPAVAVAFDVPLERCQQRSAERTERPVPDEVVARQHATFHRHLDHLATEGFAEIAVLSDEDVGASDVLRVPAGTMPTPEPVAAEAPERPPAVIIDLDGTLASATWRTHHLAGGRKDWDAFFAGMGRDAPVGPLVDLASWVGPHAEVILLTGRPDDHEAVVRRWLADHDVPYDQLLMRPSGDRRPDVVMKRERYRRDIAPRFDVRLVLDDRPGVIEMFREEGLYVLTAVDPDLTPSDA